MTPPYRVLIAALLPNLMINAAVWNVRGLNRRDHQGDFNTVLDSSEVCGLSGDIRGLRTSFVVPARYRAHTRAYAWRAFTWHNCSRDARSLWKRLDRFDNYLARTTEFIPSVCSIWRHHIVGSAMYAVTRKLKALKPIFRAQRKRKGDLSTNVSLAKGFLDSAQTLLAADRHCPTLLHLEYCWTTRDRLIDLRYLRPLARHILTVDEAEALILPVSPAEIKKAIFDIDETKAPGPDGYSAGFYKAAWPVIGVEVTQAILEFFRTGRLLKQINTTLISLIPKVNNPTVVAEFRPISCCNVLYKAITKILVQRLRSILDTLISPSQNAFVPGRSIGDNILLAQELFSGYNQRNQPPRCALKVDLRKAYDTVEWDFLKATLTLFGFSGTVHSVDC
ncbi:UNVERIFIED_CONTAM: hypothetical protein Sradi_6926800 [Sesamum radiatum]|uniref:Reverse transcriptase domain-containing protein n=1 Tax=Sesamum radiatum TaxID=300843 RepID=A0AAW2JH90_SESRA